MKLLKMEKVKDGKYLKNFELTYLNNANKEKKYEIVSRRDLQGPEELGAASSGLSVVAICDGKLLLLNEFRMGVNKRIYNLCAGMLEKGESTEECIRRELYEESGLELSEILCVLPPSFAAVAISDTVTNIAIIKACGTISPHPSCNEDIIAGLYTKEQVKELLEKDSFSSRAQLAAFVFSIGGFDSYLA